MGVVTFNESITSAVPATKLFNALVIDAHSIVPKVAPHAIKSMELIEGNGGPGSVTEVHFAEGIPIKYAKNKVDILDKDNLIFAHTVIEGGELSDKITSIKHELKFESSADGGCVGHSTVTYTVKEGCELTEEEVNPAKQSALGIVKAVEAYLLAQ